MKITFTTTYDKKLKYKIFEPNGKKRKLLAKGKVKNNCEIDFETESNEVILRIAKSNFFVAFLKWLLTTVLEFFYGDWTRYRLNPYYEIRITDIDSSRDVLIYYRGTANTVENAAFAKTSAYPLICVNFPFEETNRNKVLNFVLLVAVTCVVIFVLAFVIAYFATH